MMIGINNIIQTIFIINPGRVTIIDNVNDNMDT